MTTLPPTVSPPRSGRAALRAAGVWPRRLARRPLLAAVAVAAVVVIGYAGFSSRRAAQFRSRLAEAHTASLSGRYHAAQLALARCHDLRPDDPDATLVAADVYRMTSNWPAAEEALDAYWAAHGDDERLTLSRLLLKAARDDTDAVAPLLAARAEQAGPGSETDRLVRQALAAGYLREYLSGKAHAVLTAWQTASPDDPLAAMLVGTLAEQIQNTEGAKEAYAAIIARDPSHHEARLRLALLLMSQRRAGDALPHLEVLREALPDNAEVAVQWALALRQLGRLDEATAALDAALDAHPNATEALAERASLALNAGDDRKAADLLDHALKVDPSLTGPRNLLIQALARLGRADEIPAQKERIRALNADAARLDVLTRGPLQDRPRDPGPPFEIAGIALRAGQVASAIRWYETALQRDPNHVPSHTALAVIYREIGNPVLETRHRALAASAKRGAP